MKKLVKDLFKNDRILNLDKIKGGDGETTPPVPSVDPPEVDTGSGVGVAGGFAVGKYGTA